jgi:hypothetical protein
MSEATFSIFENRSLLSSNPHRYITLPLQKLFLVSSLPLLESPLPQPPIQPIKPIIAHINRRILHPRTPALVLHILVRLIASHILLLTLPLKLLMRLRIGLLEGLGVVQAPGVLRPASIFAGTLRFRMLIGRASGSVFVVVEFVGVRGALLLVVVAAYAGSGSMSVWVHMEMGRGWTYRGILPTDLSPLNAQGVAHTHDAVGAAGGLLVWVGV